jgi:hypothetical protein
MQREHRSFLTIVLVFFLFAGSIFGQDIRLLDIKSIYIVPNGDPKELEEFRKKTRIKLRWRVFPNRAEADAVLRYYENEFNKRVLLHSNDSAVAVLFEMNREKDKKIAGKALDTLRKIIESEVKTRKKELERSMKEDPLTWEAINNWQHTLDLISRRIKSTYHDRMQEKIWGKQADLKLWTDLYRNWGKGCSWALTDMTIPEIHQEFHNFINYTHQEYPLIAANHLRRVSWGTDSPLCPPYSLSSNRSTTRLSGWQVLLLSIAAGLKAYGDSYSKTYNQTYWPYSTFSNESNLQDPVTGEYYGRLRIGLNNRVYDEDGNYIGNLDRHDGLYGKLNIRENKVYDANRTLLGTLKDQP